MNITKTDFQVPVIITQFLKITSVRSLLFYRSMNKTNIKLYNDIDEYKKS